MKSSNHPLDNVVSAQKAGQARGITSICSAHPFVLEAVLLQGLLQHEPVLIEATCNQVNQFGGYTGMRPADFVRFVSSIADKVSFLRQDLILGGDHLGPSVWQAEPSDSAMQKSEVLIHDYVQAGFMKVHLDCSMKLADDPVGALDIGTVAQRTAQLANVAENTARQNGVGNSLRYIIGSEVPVPGGATEHEEGVSVTKIADVKQTIDAMREAFRQLSLESAWERVVGVVVQPGVEFGDDFILKYQPDAAYELSKFIESQPLIYEAHSTDYQTRNALRNLVRDHFAILKVGPGLTFAFREAVFALAAIEDLLFSETECSNVVGVLDDVMLQHPAYWKKYYQGDEQQQAFKRKFSFSDRIRYYWADANVQAALERLLKHLGTQPLPLSLLSQYLPQEYEKVRAGETENQPRSLLLDHVEQVLEDYAFACGSD